MRICCVLYRHFSEFVPKVHLACAHQQKAHPVMCHGEAIEIDGWFVHFRAMTKDLTTFAANAIPSTEKH